MKNSYEKSKQSFITPSILKEIVSRHNFNPRTLTGGNLDSAKAEVLSLTEKHKFISPILLDFDFRFNINNKLKRIYNHDNISCYLFDSC